MNHLIKYDDFKINEKLLNVEDDVNMLYDLYFKNDYNEIQKTGIITDDMFKQSETDTSILTSPLCKESHTLNPCIIQVNIKSNSYDPFNQKINISVNKSAIFFIKSNNNSIEKSIEDLYDPKDKISLSREFKETTIKGSIHHELAHWIDDTLHNQHIKNNLNVAQEAGVRIPNVNAKYFEIQGQIHNIKQLYNKYLDIWDTLSLMDMISLSPSLSTIYKELPKSIKDEWIIKIKRRMHREGLLGAKMR